MGKIKGYSLLNNVTFLYFIVIVFLLNLGIFLYNKDNQSIFLIACSALIVYVFNNNMIIVMLLSMLIVNSLIIINKLIGKKEGLENSDSTTTPTANTTTTTADTTTTTADTIPPPANQGGEPQTTIQSTSNTNAELIKRINIAIAGVKSSSEKLEKLDPELDIDLKEINAKLNDLYEIAS